MRNSVITHMDSVEDYRRADDAAATTNPAPSWKQIAKAGFGKTQFLFSAGEWLHLIDGGVLYRIHPGNGGWVAVEK